MDDEKLPRALFQHRAGYCVAGASGRTLSLDKVPKNTTFVIRSTDPPTCVDMQLRDRTTYHRVLTEMDTVYSRVKDAIAKVGQQGQIYDFSTKKRDVYVVFHDTKGLPSGMGWRELATLSTTKPNQLLAGGTQWDLANTWARASDLATSARARASDLATSARVRASDLATRVSDMTVREPQASPTGPVKYHDFKGARMPYVVLREERYVRLQVGAPGKRCWRVVERPPWFDRGSSPPSSTDPSSTDWALEEQPLKIYVTTPESTPMLTTVFRLIPHASKR